MSALPSWAGTVPQMITAAGVLSLLGIAVTAVFRFIPAWARAMTERRQVRQEAEADIRDHYARAVGEYREEVKGLRDELKECEAECDRRLKKAERDLWGEKRQRVTEQISLINTIIASVDAPELKAMLKTLESVQAHLTITELTVDGDGK